MLRSLSNLSEERPDVARGNFKCPMLNLPSWDQPALINWEPLEPPSPFLPVVQRRAYPSVVSGMLRAAVSPRAPEREATADSPGAAEAETPREVTFEEEEMAQRCLFNEETSARQCIVFAEQFESTRLWVEVLHCISVILEVDILSAEEEARSTYEREEDRLRMCYIIEMKTVGNRIQKRQEDEMRRKFTQLIPLHKEGFTSILQEEAGELAQLLDWFRTNRPFGMRLPTFLSGEPRRMQPRKPTGGRNVTYRGRGSRTFVPKVQATARSELDSWPDVFPEPSYLEEGRMVWALVKSLRYGQRKSCTSKNEVEEQEAAAREEILAEEAGKWLPMIALAVDECHEAKRRTQERDKAETIAIGERLEELQKRTALLEKLEEEDAIGWEKAAIKQLQEREAMFRKQLDEEDSFLTKRETGAQQLDGSTGGGCVEHDRDGEPRLNIGACAEVSSSSESGSNDLPLYPMLNVVLSAALERDSYAGLHNPGFSALAEAECLLAVCEGRSAGRAAQAFASASRMPFCRMYLMQGLWWPNTSTGKAKCPGEVRVAGDGAPYLYELAKLEAVSRSVFLQDQIAAALDLYQQAAREASTISGTKYGEVYYVGVRMPSNF
ncbi:hypothetical protein TraAM80_04923 [Trypanosoma rangeli]|uniref:Uncharacterized protein n=1 Tax=Trypanosoma rangeli TaxID=5698 RepID=A0A3R7MFC1_TRYRA|nr:uncharacterized protein TraAM80_04923 [Trypanosoma rangeli]RNF04797.1 hypothetical protein TraAM80_04923 [Trypanosoma rangeli]|eukprot:RNF04797.1 hypothetical protein TraAM80_04923 [Trypanosoma rangeli]